MPLSKLELERYQRQLLVEGWDQEKLKNARVLIVGTGGLGGISSIYLAAAGVGHLRVCDSDTVELSNLNRQILFTSDDLGMPKAILASRKLSALNPDLTIETISDTLTESNAAELAAECDLIIDGLDNHAGRLILNQVSCDLKIPFIYGAINDWQGQLGFFNPPNTACLACIMPGEMKGPKPTPVFGALPALIASLQATLALRYLMARETPLTNSLLIFHADTMTSETVSFEKRPGCAVCKKTG